MRGDGGDDNGGDKYGGGDGGDDNGGGTALWLVINCEKSVVSIVCFVE